MKELLAKAISLAATRHEGQFDRGGMPYFLHVSKVMHYTRSTDMEVLMIAVMHDLVEDTQTTYQELRDLGFSERVIAGIKALTKVPGQTQEEYMDGIKSNKDAITVKLADLRHNSDIRRLKGIRDKDIERLKKYNAMYLELRELV